MYNFINFKCWSIFQTRLTWFDADIFSLIHGFPVDYFAIPALNWIEPRFRCVSFNLIAQTVVIILDFPYWRFLGNCFHLVWHKKPRSLLQLYWLCVPMICYYWIAVHCLWRWEVVTLDGCATAYAALISGTVLLNQLTLNWFEWNVIDKVVVMVVVVVVVIVASPTATTVVNLARGSPSAYI